jgi:squalene monooxygenase
MTTQDPACHLAGRNSGSIKSANKGPHVELRLGWTSAPNQRGSVDIIWGCVLVLFVCVWAVLHHNVPLKSDHYWSVFSRKLRWATLAVCAPELLTLFAIMQWNAANISVAEMKVLGEEDWTVVHAFYANGGGFILNTPDCPPFPINAKSIHHLRFTGWIKPLEITRENIWDRSKADLFAKGFALIQTSWLLIQCITRATQQLAITPLELFTLAFILPTIATCFFWWNKPQNVDEPTVITTEWLIADLLKAAGDAAKEPFVDTPMDFIEKLVWQGWRRRPSLLHFGGLTKRPLARIPNDYSPPPPTGKEAMFMWVISVIHAGVHVLGWTLSFPTYTEGLIWRVSSITLLVVMVIGGAVPVLSTREWFDFSFNLLWIWIRPARKNTWMRRNIFDLVVNFAYLVYIIARVLIFAEIFLSFRSLPETAYEEINWAAFLPHIN